MSINFTELEINIKFPTCWDGVNLEDVDGTHVAYSEECQEDFNECFDFDCPVSHPVKMPEIHLYTRVVNYEGGAHVFANDTDVSGIMRILIILTKIVLTQVFHSDYFSGWDHEFLQYVLDECENYSEAAMPDAFCSDFLTFRGRGKEDGTNYDGEWIMEDLEKMQPDPVDIKGTITAEDVTNIPELQRGVCTGTLIDA